MYRGTGLHFSAICLQYEVPPIRSQILPSSSTKQAIWMVRSEPCFSTKTIFLWIRVPILKMKRSSDRLLFMMAIVYWQDCVFIHDDVIKWKHFPLYWPFVRGIHRWPVNSPLKGQWRGALMFFLSAPWINNREAGKLRRHRAHFDVIVNDQDGPHVPVKIWWWFSPEHGTADLGWENYLVMMKWCPSCPRIFQIQSYKDQRKH